MPAAACSRLVPASKPPLDSTVSRFGASRGFHNEANPIPPAPTRNSRAATDRPDPRGMPRDAAAAPAAAVASPPIAAETGREREAPAEVVIDVDGVPAVVAAAHGVACRICHLGPEGGDGPAAAGGSEVIRLGCGCKGELGDAHRHCAEAWFRIKGDRCCEICGSDAKNITGLEVKIFMEEWHGRRVVNTITMVERESTCWRRQPFCNFLLACLLIAFMLPWFFRVNIF